MLELPWPPSSLSPNARKHWAAKMPVKNKYKLDCFYIATQNLHKYEMGKMLHISLVFHPPSNRRYDLDNLLSRMKSGLDGIAEAWKLNDAFFQPITIRFGETVKGGKVIFSVIT
jgi:crossover junction endodeoxyribonuclease RusA